jgi:hypothetical protein
LAIGPAFGHAYCPTTSEEANNFLPHRWVLEAIQSAFLDGQQFALGGMNFRMQLYGFVPPKQEASSPDIAQPTQKSE